MRSQIGSLILFSNQSDKFEGLISCVALIKLQQNLDSILPTFYAQFLGTQIPRAQNDSQVIGYLFCFWDLCA